jgi:putative tryptophan/tyrosine transport system substrate-binding protein
MRRRELLLLVGGTITVARALRAQQQPIKVFRLGMIVPSRPLPGTRLFEERLREFDYEEGRNLQINSLQLLGTDTDRIPELAAQLVGRGVDVILAGGPEVALKAAMAATRTVPIVIVAIDYDPLTSGHVGSLAHPGGNVTGVFFGRSN